MSIIDSAKEAVKLVQQIDNIELYRKILDMQSEAIELSEKMKEKDAVIRKLKEALELKGKLVYKESTYFLVAENNKIVDGPFCTKCFDVDHIKCRVVAHTCHPSVKCLKCDKIFDSVFNYNYLTDGKRFDRIEVITLG